MLQGKRKNLKASKVKRACAKSYCRTSDRDLCRCGLPCDLLNFLFVRIRASRARGFPSSHFSGWREREVSLCMRISSGKGSRTARAHKVGPSTADEAAIFIGQSVSLFSIWLV